MFADDTICNSQQGYEKVLSITSHQGNENQNHNKISASACENREKGITGIKNVGKNVGKGELLCTVAGIINWYSHKGIKQYGSSPPN